MKKKIAILSYHKFGIPPGDWYTWNYVSEENFAKQLDFIYKHNLEVLSAEKFTRSLNDPAILPERSLLITFDDGYRNNLTVALPHLKNYNYPAVLFVPVNFVGGYNAFDADILYEPKEEICSWEELKELEYSGISIQSHGISHPHFSKISHHEMKHEVGDSKILEANLHKEVELFAFPFGDSGKDKDVTKAILKKCGYSAAFLYHGGVFEVGHHDPFQIPRIPVGTDTDIVSELKRALFF